MSKSKIIISDLNLSESLTPLSEKEQDQIRGGGVPVNQIEGGPSKTRQPGYICSVFGNCVPPAPPYKEEKGDDFIIVPV